MKRVFVSILGFMLASASFSQQGVEKDQQLQQLIQKATTNYSRIKELEIQFAANDVNEELIRTAWQPTVSADASYRYSVPNPAIDFPSPTGVKSVQFTPANNYNAGINVSQLLYDFGKTRAQLQKSNAEKKIFQDNIDLLKNSIAYQVVQIYFTIGFLQNSINVQNDQINSLKATEKLIDAKVRNGDALQYDLLTTQVRIANASNKLADLQSQLERQYIALELFTGQDQRGKLDMSAIHSSVALISNYQAVDWQSTNIEAQQIKHRLQSLDIDYKNANIKNRPSVFAQAGGGVRNGYQPEIEQLKLNATVGVGVSVPIFSGGRSRLERKITQINIDAAKQSLQTLENNIKRDLSNVNEDYKNLQIKLNNTNLLVQQAQKAYDLAQVRFKNGLITSAELVTAQTNIEDAKLTQVQLEYQMQLDRLDSQKIIGTRMW